MEPTDEMLDAHEQARRAYWANLGHDTGEGGMTAAEHERVAQRQAMKAALAVVERDYYVTLRADMPYKGWLIEHVDFHDGAPVKGCTFCKQDGS